MNDTTTVASSLTTLNDAYHAWLEMDHPSKPGLKNKDRGVTDLLNYQRALRCFELGASAGMDEQSLSPADTLAVNELLLARYVEQGLKTLYSRKGKGEPNEKTLKNLIACCRALQASALGEGVKAKSYRQIRKARPKPKLRSRFPYHAWPQELQAEWQAYAEWKTKPILGPHEGAKHRSQACRQKTIKMDRSRINPYVGYLVRERGMLSPSLQDLCQLSLYSEYLNWYLTQDADGGFTCAKCTGTSLGSLSHYLVATGKLEERTADGTKISTAFYELSNEPLKIGASRGQLKAKKDVGVWKPWHLFELGAQAFETPVVKTWRGDDLRYQKQVLCRKRSALFFILAHETPLRVRNFIEMKWHKNLKRTPEGLWRVSFSGDELKVSTRGYATNVYERTYSKTTSRFIDAYRDFLREAYGDFESRSPFVFVSADLGNAPVSYPAFATHISQVCEEFRGERFNPHKVRHILASYLVNEFGAGGLGLAAELLGDTVEVILKSYYRPNNEKAMQDYLTRCEEGDSL